MALILNEEQRLLQDTALEFLGTNAPVAALRKLRDERDELGYSAELWQQMVELGWASIILPEQYGGLEFGFAGMGALVHACGRHLTASPLVATGIIGASAILLGGSEAQKDTLLRQVAGGELTLALALEESNHHRPNHVATRAQAAGEGWTLNGNKLFVMDGHSADTLIVVARTRGESRDYDGISLFLVDGQAPGVQRQRTIMADSRNAANIVFDNVQLPADALLGELHEGWPVLEAALDRGRVALAAEMLGNAWEAFDRTITYLKEREQFGALIGSYQALQHRAAFMYTELELARSVVLQACSTVDDDPGQLPAMASLAKARLNDVAKLVTNEAVQMHGGIGVTDELDIGLFLKRVRVAMQLLGDAGYHKDRYATLNGY